jgi:hypothetical protein
MEQTAEQPSLIQTRQPGYQEAWEMVLSQLRMEMSRPNFETWVQPLQPVSYKEGVFRIGAANAYGRDWVETRLRTRITRLLESLFSQPVTVHFTLINSRADKLYTPAQPAEEPVLDQTGGETKAKTAANGAARANGGRKMAQPAADGREEGSSPRKIQLQRAYGTERASIIQPERGMFLTMYFFNNWLPLLGHSAYSAVLAARSLCYWNPMTGELRNTVETDMGDLARRASVSVRTIKDVLNNELIKRYFLRYKVRRVMTPNGVRTAGIILQVRMDDPLTPEDQTAHELDEEERWYTADFENEEEA